MRKIEKEDFFEFTKFLFKSNKKLQMIFVLHTLTDIPSISPAPHWHIDLPDSIEEFYNTLGKETRRETKRKIGLIERDMEKFTIEKYDREHIDYSLVNLYLSWKKDSHNFLYKSAEDYIRDFYVTSMYVLKTPKDVLAIEFISETNNEEVYAENFSYNMNYRDYSVGVVLYYHVIKDLIKNKKKKFYLLGGNYEYKKNYNGVCTMTRSGNVYRHPYLAKICTYIADRLNKLKLPRVLKKMIVKIVGFFMVVKFYKKMLKSNVLTL